MPLPHPFAYDVNFGRQIVASESAPPKGGVGLASLFNRPVAALFSLTSILNRLDPRAYAYLSFFLRSAPTLVILFYIHAYTLASRATRLPSDHTIGIESRKMSLGLQASTSARSPILEAAKHKSRLAHLPESFTVIAKDTQATLLDIPLDSRKFDSLLPESIRESLEQGSMDRHRRSQVLWN